MGPSCSWSFLLLVYFKPGFLDLFLDSKIEQSGIEVPSHFIYKTQLQRIKNALEIYYLREGKLPEPP